MTKDKAYWNMHRVLERILASCDFQKSLPESLPDALPPSSSEEAWIGQRKFVTKSGRIITIIRQPPHLIGQRKDGVADK